MKTCGSPSDDRGKNHPPPGGVRNSHLVYKIFCAVFIVSAESPPERHSARAYKVSLARPRGYPPDTTTGGIGVAKCFPEEGNVPKEWEFL